MTVTMSDAKAPTEPTVIFTTAQAEFPPVVKPGRLTRKHVFRAGVMLLATGIVVAAVLVGIHLVTKSNLELETLRYTLKMKDKENHNVEQNVSVEANSVKYHVVKGDSEFTIINDFDKDIQVTKVTSQGHTTCYVTPLNRSEAADPNSIPSSAPVTNDSTPNRQLIYKLSDNPISDISFLGERAVSMCHGYQTYWLHPMCSSDVAGTIGSNTTDGTRQKRATVVGSCYGVSYAYGYAYWRYWPCACGGCSLVCGHFASNYFYYYYSNGYYVNVYIMYAVCANISLRPYNCWYSGNYCYSP